MDDASPQCDDEDATDGVPRATQIGFHVCSHGTLWINLLDEKGAVFACAALDAETAIEFLGQAGEGIDAFIDSLMPPDNETVN